MLGSSIKYGQQPSQNFGLNGVAGLASCMNSSNTRYASFNSQPIGGQNKGNLTINIKISTRINYASGMPATGGMPLLNNSHVQSKIQASSAHQQPTINYYSIGQQADGNGNYFHEYVNTGRAAQYTGPLSSSQRLQRSPRKLLIKIHLRSAPGRAQQQPGNMTFKQCY
jgi:hypothetical protein